MLISPFSETKVFAHSDKIAQLIVTRDIIPVTVYIELTNKCTFSCTECDIPKGKDELDYDTLVSVIEELKINKIQGIVLTGGEPFLYPRIKELLEYLKSTGIKIGLETSAELIGNLSRDVIETCSWVKIPLEVINSEEFSTIRKCKGERLISILANIKQLIDIKRTLNSRCEIILETKIVVGLIQNVDKFIDWTVNIGVDMVYITHARNKNGLICVKNVNDFLYLQNKSWYNKFKVLFNSSFKNANKARCYKKCFGHFFKTYISSNGGIYLCRDHRNKNEYCYGNINQFSFSNIWDGMLRTDIINNLNISKCPLHCHCDGINNALQIFDLKEYRAFL